MALLKRSCRGRDRRRGHASSAGSSGDRAPRPPASGGRACGRGAPHRHARSRARGALDGRARAPARPRRSRWRSAFAAVCCRAFEPCAVRRGWRPPTPGPGCTRCASRSRSAATRSRAGNPSRARRRRSQLAPLVHDAARARAAGGRAAPARRPARRRAAFGTPERARAPLACARPFARGALGGAADRDADAAARGGLARVPARARRASRAGRASGRSSVTLTSRSISSASSPVRRRAAHSSSWASRRAAARIATRPARRVTRTERISW